MPESGVDGSGAAWALRRRPDGHDGMAEPRQAMVPLGTLGIVRSPIITNQEIRSCHV